MGSPDLARKLRLAAVGLIDEDKLSIVGRLQLLVRIERLDAVNGAIRREIDFQRDRKSV